MNVWSHLRKLLAYLAPEHPLLSPRKHIAVVAALLAVAAIAGAVVLTPSRHGKRKPVAPAPDAWTLLRERISNRAQIDLFDDFSHGLDAWGEAWDSGQNQATTWSYDKNGFVSLGRLSLFEPSLHLTDYDVDALVQIESKGLGLVFRASSPRDYQVAKLMVNGSGPMPALAVERYAVIAGHQSRPAINRYPEHFQPDTLYRLHLEVRRDAFAIYVQGNLIDYWTDPRFKSGGIGLFCSPGEHARVAWVRVSHNADSVGRICSLLASMF